MPEIELRNLTKEYEPGKPAVRDLNLRIADGEFIILVGPSGCGKTTVLRMIAGLEEITSGEFLMDGRRMNEVEPQRREIAMVFQSYALYPHMTVEENLAFPLRLRNTPVDETERRIKQAATILGLGDMLKRIPRELSGGQRQRVALGRAMVREPRLFLFDEPLSNLDAKLRAEMRVEIGTLHHRLGANFLYVTHDQTEAMTLGSRIAVLKDGLLQQFATPEELFHYPANTFVAGFIGTPAMNFLNAEVAPDNDGLALNIGLARLPLPAAHAASLSGAHGRRVTAGIRPKDLHLRPSADTARQKLSGKLVHREPLGDETLYYVEFSPPMNPDKTVIIKEQRDEPLPLDAPVDFYADLDRLYLFDAETGRSLLEVRGQT